MGDKTWADFWLDFLHFSGSNPPYFHVTFRAIVTFCCFMPAKKYGKFMAFFHERKKVRFSIFVTIYSNTTVYGNLLKMSQFSKKKILFLKLILKENRIFLIFFPDFFQSETFFFEKSGKFRKSQFFENLENHNFLKISKITIFWKSRKYQFFENVIYFQTETFFFEKSEKFRNPICWKSRKSQFFENLIFVLKIKYNETSH